MSGLRRCREEFDGSAIKLSESEKMRLAGWLAGWLEQLAN